METICTLRHGVQHLGNFVKTYCFITDNIILVFNIELISREILSLPGFDYALTMYISLLSRQVHSRFGVVTSFTGTYKADQWSLTLSSSQGTNTLFMTDLKCHSMDQ